MKNIFFYFSAIFLATSCIEPIEFETELSAKNIVVEGSITNQPGPYTVKLSTPSPYGSQQVRPVGAATITLFENSMLLGEFEEKESGQYILESSNFRGEPGKMYHIEIVLEDGRTYRSQPERLPEPVPVDSLVFSIESQVFLSEFGREQEKQFAKIESVFSIPETEESVFLRWEAESHYSFIDVDAVLLQPPGLPKVCYIPDLPNPQRIELFNGQQFEANTTFQQEVVGHDADYTFNWARGYRVRQFSITEKAHAYRADLQKVANVEGTIFDPPPAAVRGNIFNVNDSEELVQGYFEAAAVDEAAYIVSPAEVKPFFNIPFPCSSNQPQGVPSGACFNCLAFPNSTTTRPEYW